MPVESQLAHRNIPFPALPYKSYVSPTDSEPFFCPGSADILTSVKGYFERRPGFATSLEGTPTTFNSVKRIFTWNRWDGTFIYMVSNVNGSNQAEVWKMINGTDAAFVKIFTDTGSATPHDYVVSNNQVYFGNGSTNRKWDPTNGLSNWGITAPANAVTLSTDPVYAGAGAGTNWTNPGNATGKPDQAYAVFNTTSQDKLKLTTYGLAIPAGANITGFIVNVTGHGLSTTSTERGVDVGITTDGSTVAGSAKTANALNLGTDTTVQLGGSGDLWGNTSISISQAQASTFGVIISKSTSTANEIDIDAASIVVYWTATNGVNAQTGWTYQECYGNSATAHVSSPSPISNSTGTVSGTSVGVKVTASADAQVNQIHVFRTTDGGGGNFFEISGSPFANSSTTVYDTTTDAALDVQTANIAPIPTFNDPPPAWLGVTYWVGRVWGIDGSVKTKVWFTGLEEINIGVNEECVPSGADGNFWSFNQQAIGLAAIGDQYLLVFCGGVIHYLSGDTRDTFRRRVLSNRRGTRNLATIATNGTMAAWLDSSKQIWATDGQQLQEPGQDIRTDLKTVTPANCSSTFHVSGEFHWFVFSTGTQIFVYDMDTDMWMPPWSVATTCIYSGETSAGNYDLLAAIGGQIYKLTPGTFNDAGTTFQWKAILSNFNLVPDYGKRFSFGALGMYDEPSRLGQPDMIATESNLADSIATVKILIDDDPTNASVTWKDITTESATQITSALQRTQGTQLFQSVWRIGKFTGRRMAVYFTGQNKDRADKIYTAFLTYRQQR